MSFKKPFRAVPLKAISPLHQRRTRPANGRYATLVVGASALTFAVVWFMSAPPAQAVQSAMHALPVSYRNCSAARAVGAAPIRADQPGYRAGLDADGDGIACEPFTTR